MIEKSNVVGEKIRELRLKLGMTQKVFAKHFGVNFTTVHYWEAGRFQPCTMLCCAIAKLARERKIKLTIDQLIEHRLVINKKPRLKK